MNRWIAPSTDGLSSFTRLPFRPWSRTSHTPAQDSPSSTHSCSFTIDSWKNRNVNPKTIVWQRKETYLDHSQEDTNRTKSGLCWCDAANLLREIESFDGHIQRREDTVAPLRPPRVFLHGRRWRYLGGTAWRTDCEGGHRD